MVGGRGKESRYVKIVEKERARGRGQEVKGRGRGGKGQGMRVAKRPAATTSK